MNSDQFKTMANPNDFGATKPLKLKVGRVTPCAPAAFCLVSYSTGGGQGTARPTRYTAADSSNLKLKTQN
jgi:hypothetical protein